MIKLVLGNVGSGKTASTIRWIKNNPHLNIYTNIAVKGKGMNHVTQLKPEMIIKKQFKRTKKTGDDVYDIEFNVDFWREQVQKYHKINVVIDEAHTFFNPRRSMSKLNIIMGDFLAMLRRILGSTDGQEGKLILITQLSRRLDVYAREMATEVSYCIHRYVMRCNRCDFEWRENNEMSDKLEFCPLCKHYNIIKTKNVIEVIDFADIESYERWKNFGERSYFRRYAIKDIRSIFGNYNTLQWDNLLTEY